MRWLARAAQQRARVSLASGCASQVVGENFADACRCESWRLAWQTETVEDLPDEDSIADRRNQLAPSTALEALEQSNSKYAFQQLGPRCALRARLTRLSGIPS